MSWLQKEWEIQWPLIRFEIYRWGGVVMGSAVLVLAAKILKGILKIPDLYFYSTLFVLASICFALLTKGKRATSGLPGKQTEEAITVVGSSGTTSITAQVIDDWYNSFDVLLMREMEVWLRQEMANMPTQAERDRILFRYCLGAIIYSMLENIWHSIYGSQIQALEKLNTPTPQLVPRSDLLPFYTAASTAWPVAYAFYTFDHWIGYLRGNYLITEQGASVGITIRGKAFLKMLVHNGRSSGQRSW